MPSCAQILKYTCTKRIMLTERWHMINSLKRDVIWAAAMLEVSVLELFFALILRVAVLSDAKLTLPALSVCQLPSHLQGVYLVQKDEVSRIQSSQGMRHNVRYDNIYVGPTFISKWGDCVGTFGRSYIFRSRQKNGSVCFSCLTILERSPNVVQVLTSERESCRKEEEEEAAKASCKLLSPEFPGEGIMLWKSEDVQYQPCPFNGKAKLVYKAADSFRRSSCTQKQCTLSNCNYGYQLDFQFKDGNAITTDMVFKCLGQWPSAKNNGEEYFGLYNQMTGEFRCGIFLEDKRVHHAALSIDSSCDNLLLNSTHGYETLTIQPVDSEVVWPALPTECTFPTWIQGIWEYMVIESNMMTSYRDNDPSSMVVAFAKCVITNEDRVQLFSKTHCNHALGYQCLHIARRSNSVIEVKYGKEKYQNYSPALCMDDRAFADLTWTALSTINPTRFVPCSFTGYYVSNKEHADKRLCYSFSSVCYHTDQLIKTTFYCRTGEVQNVLNYDCLASWKEDGYRFDYVKLRNANRRGCFASRLLNGKLYVVWTGKECQRNVDFEKLEEGYDEKLIVLKQQKQCTDQDTGEGSRTSTNCNKPICSHASTTLPLQRSFTFPLYVFVHALFIPQ